MTDKRGPVAILLEQKPHGFLTQTEIEHMVSAAQDDYAEQGSAWKLPHREVYKVWREATKKKCRVTITWSVIQ